MTGLALLSRLRGAGVAVPPVIVVSAHAQPEHIDAAVAAGVTRYLTKPLNMREVLALVDELLASTPTGERAE